MNNSKSKLIKSHLPESVKRTANVPLHSYAFVKPRLSLNPLGKSPFNASLQLILLDSRPLIKCFRDQHKLLVRVSSLRDKKM